jgi:Putative beta-barrel porin-2, OmpL-like. bbp2
MFNAEPFTHTGVLGTYKVNDKLTMMAGWVLGWDTGFDQFGNGNAVHAGFTYQMSDSVKYSYMATGGDLGWRGDGYSHSNVFDFTLSKKWEYVLQSDLVTASANANQSTTEALAYGVNNYLFYTINDCWKWGTRAEWYKTNQVTGQTTSFNEVATGLNYKVNANFTVRPEVKFNWTPSDEAYENATGGDFNQTLFGMDAIYTF